METIEFLQRFASTPLDGLMLVVSGLGDALAYIALLVIIYLGFDPALGRRVGVVLLVSLFINAHLKAVVDSPRPFTLDPTLARGDAAIETAGGAGFPSGHAQGVATFWGYLALRVRRRDVWVTAAVIVGMVSVSRLYLGVHVPGDVLGGIAVAVVVLVVALAMERYAPPLAVRGTPLRRWPARRLRQLGFALGLLVPLALHLFLPVDRSALLMGGLAALLTAPLLIRYRLPATVGRRAGAAALGLVLVFVALLGSGALLPEPVKADPVAGFLRYLSIGYVGLALVPYLARRLGGDPPSPEQAEAEVEGAPPSG